MTNEAIWDDNPVNVTAEVNFIWSIANRLRGPYRSDKYKDVIIPMTIIRRLECALEPTKPKVIAMLEKDPKTPDLMVQKATGYPFFNRSRFDLKKLLDDPDNVADNFRNYLNGFSRLVADIIASLDFDKQIEKMDKNNRLYSVVEAFSELDLSPRTIDNVKMGYVFEELIRKFSEDAEAGDHYTGRDIVKLMVGILMAEGSKDVMDDHKVVTVGDYACGTGGMLSTTYNYLRHLNPTIDVELFGQEINPESYAICLAEMLIKGQNPDHIKKCDSMQVDSFGDQQMRFIIMNPPFGTPWAGKEAADGVETAVKAEFSRGGGRFPAGLPSGGDMQLLFLQAAVQKLSEANGRAAIIENGSPLFAGGVSSGESQIRKWLLDNDYLEAIIALPKDLFYNTGITTYIWVLSKNKRKARRGKVQLIDASGFYKGLNKSLGNKRVEITPQDREKIIKLYQDFAENEHSLIKDNDDFKYREWTVYRKAPKGADAKSIKIDGEKVWVDPESKDTETVPFKERVEDYMAREVVPHVPDAVWVLEEDLGKKKPVIKTGAEFPFTRYFYQYEQPQDADTLLKELVTLGKEIEAGLKELAK